MSRAELLRGHAEAPCPHRHQVEGEHNLCLGPLATSCKDTGLDPRFSALRGEHAWHFTASTKHCYRCNVFAHKDNPGPAYCLRTDVGSVLRAAAACGPEVLEAAIFAVLAYYSHETDAETLEDAAAVAFAAAVQERAS